MVSLATVQAAVQTNVKAMFAPSATTQFMNSVMKDQASSCTSRMGSAFNWFKECVAISGSKREITNLLGRATANLNARTLRNFLASVERAAAKAGIQPSNSTHSKIACALVNQSSASPINKQALLASIHQKYGTTAWGARHAAVGAAGVVAGMGIDAYVFPHHVDAVKKSVLGDDEPTFLQQVANHPYMVAAGVTTLALGTLAYVKRDKIKAGYENAKEWTASKWEGSNIQAVCQKVAGIYQASAPAWAPFAVNDGKPSLLRRVVSTCTFGLISANSSGK